MRLDELDYRLPREQIAQRPLEQREASRLLLLDRSSGVFKDQLFTEFPSLLRGDELLVINNARVIPARLFGKRAGVHSQPPSRATRSEHLTGKVEIFLTRQLDPQTWEALVRPGRKMRVGERILFGAGELEAEVLGRGELGLRTLRLHRLTSTVSASSSSGWATPRFRRTSIAPMKHPTASAIKRCTPNVPARLPLPPPVFISRPKFWKKFALGAQRSVS